MNCLHGKLYRDKDGKLRQAFYFNGVLQWTEAMPPAPPPPPKP